LRHCMIAVARRISSGKCRSTPGARLARGENRRSACYVSPCLVSVAVRAKHNNLVGGDHEMFGKPRTGVPSCSQQVCGPVRMRLPPRWAGANRWSVLLPAAPPAMSRKVKSLAQPKGLTRLRAWLYNISRSTAWDVPIRPTASPMYPLPLSKDIPHTSRIDLTPAHLVYCRSAIPCWSIVLYAGGQAAVFLPSVGGMEERRC
jgi:hypothetical protein